MNTQASKEMMEDCKTEGAQVPGFRTALVLGGTGEIGKQVFLKLTKINSREAGRDLPTDFQLR